MKQQELVMLLVEITLNMKAMGIKKKLFQLKINLIKLDHI